MSGELYDMAVTWEITLPKLAGSFTMGSAFSGLGSDFFAMKRLGKQFNCCFWAECNPSCQTVLHESHQEHMSFSDIRSPEFALAPRVTLFTAGFPCQPYSKAGPSLGTNDAHKRGTLVYYVLRYLAQQHPDSFVLENVPGLLQQRHSSFLEMVLRVLTSLVDARGQPLQPDCKTLEFRASVLPDRSVQI